MKKYLNLNIFVPLGLIALGAAWMKLALDMGGAGIGDASVWGTGATFPKFLLTIFIVLNAWILIVELRKASKAEAKESGEKDKGTLRVVLMMVVLFIYTLILPIITYKTLDEAFTIVRSFEKPLATYIFSDSKQVQHRVITELPFGGATINDVVIHLANNHMGFGGVGNSGMGAYHGKTGFDCFTHYKSTLSKGTWLELPVRNPPFGNKISLLRLLMR